MLINLVSNAIRYSNTGKIKIKIKSFLEFCWVEIRDQGPGIKP